jgi:hypothetical protein
MFGKAINSIQNSWKNVTKVKEFKDYSAWIKGKIDLQKKIYQVYERENDVSR